jgi:phospholipid-binding lipoprotein MlaA
LVADLQAGPTQYIDDGAGTLAGVTVLRVVSTRSGLLGASKVLDDVALDKYSFLRDLYLARRKNQVYDGDPPPEPEEADPEAKP